MSSGSPRERRRLAWCQRRTEAPARRKGAPTRRPRALASRIPTVGSYSLYEFISMPYHCNKGFLGVTPLKLQCGTCRSFSCDAGPLLKAGDRLLKAKRSEKVPPGASRRHPHPAAASACNANLFASSSLSTHTHTHTQQTPRARAAAAVVQRTIKWVAARAQPRHLLRRSRLLVQLASVRF